MPRLQTQYVPIRSLSGNLGLVGLVDSTDTNYAAATAQNLAMLARLPAAWLTWAKQYHRLYWMTNANVSTMATVFHNTGVEALTATAPSVPWLNPGPWTTTWILQLAAPYTGSANNRFNGGLALHEFARSVDFWCGQVVSSTWTNFSAANSTWQTLFTYAQANGANPGTGDEFGNAADLLAGVLRCFYQGSNGGAGGDTGADNDLMCFFHGIGSTYNSSDTQIVAVRNLFAGITFGPPG